MQTAFFFKKMSSAEEQQIQEYVAKKLHRVERLTEKMPQDAVMLHIAAEKFEKHSAFGVELVLTVPSHKFIAKEDSHAITKAVDDAFDRLLLQIKKSKEESQESKTSQM